MRTATLIITFILFFISFQTKAQDQIKWLSWNEGYPEAVKSDKILLIDLYTDWCKWCEVMDQKTYSQQNIIQAVNKDFISVKFNPEIKGIKYKIGNKEFGGRELYSMLIQNQRAGFPTTIFVFVNERKVYLQPGYQNPENFQKILTSFSDLKKQALK